MNNYKISVIVPMYNVEKYITKCLTSLIEQTLNPIEIIVINDGSIDESRALAAMFEQRYENVVICDKPNGGLSDARNFGIKKAKGEYIALIDSDDYVDQTMMEKLYEKAIRLDADIACCDLMYVNEDMSQSISKGAYFSENSFQEDENIININNSACNKIFRRSFLNDKEFPKGKWYEDLAVIPAWVAKANKVVYVEEPLYFYVQRSGSIVHSLDQRIFDVYWAIENVSTLIETTTHKKPNLSQLYLDNGLVMTNLRIKEFKDYKIKLKFIQENIMLLSKHLPTWYKKCMCSSQYSIQQKVIFTLLKMKKIDSVLRIYQRGAR